jgi:hypothetical protein
MIAAGSDQTLKRDRRKGWAGIGRSSCGMSTVARDGSCTKEGLPEDAVPQAKAREDGFGRRI